MKIAYLILAHNTPSQTARLISALDGPQSRFYIHVDGKFSLRPFQEKVVAGNAVFLQERVPVYWGEFTQVRAILNLIRAGLTGSPDYLVLLSGSDYPIKNRDAVERFFMDNRGNEFMNLVAMPCEEVNKRLSRLTYYKVQSRLNWGPYKYALEKLNHFINEVMRLERNYAEVFGQLAPYAGSTWWALTASACRHILAFTESNPKIVGFFENVALPDESYFQTVLGNSQFKKHIAKNLTFTKWEPRSSSPAWLDREHVQYFRANKEIVLDDAYGRGPALFARKFKDDSAGLIQEIQQHVW